MKKYASLALGAVVVMLSGCSASLNEHNPIDAKLGVEWMQSSGEFDALSYQAFNNAKLAFLKNKVKGKNAVVVDLDETMISNSAYAAWQVKNNQSYSSDSWNQWCEAREATEIPGAVDFANFVVKHGGDIFYVSNRKQKVYDATVDNLNALKFPQVDAKHILLREKSSDKASRINKILKDGYKVVLMVGDNLNDFGSDVYHKTNKERSAYVQQHKNNYGTKWIVLPNPNYGGFQTSDLKMQPWSGK